MSKSQKLARLPLVQFMVDLAQSLLEENQIKMISDQFNDSS